jgi:glycosyltransferase involved in cell wall biosynthesis
MVHTFHGHIFQGYFGSPKTLFFIWVEKILALFTDRIITVSGALKKELVETYKIAPEKKFSVVELGFELDELFKLAPKENDEIVNIGIVGRLVPIKNHKMLFKSLCRGGFETRPYRIVVIGDGELRGELENYARKLGIIDMVEFMGWVKDLKAIYEGLDIVVLTSLNEGTPVSLIEAMASARPVAATRVGGVADIVQDGKSGYLVESGDEENFGRKLIDLIKDPERRRKFGEYGRNIVRNRFSKERLIKDTKELYNNTLQKNKNN